MIDPIGEWAFTGTAFQTDGTQLYTFTARTTIVADADGAVQVIVRTDKKQSRSVSAPALPRPQADGGMLLLYDYIADPGHEATAGHDFFGMTRLRFAADGQSAAGNYMNFNGRYTCGECRLERI